MRNLVFSAATFAGLFLAPLSAAAGQGEQLQSDQVHHDVVVTLEASEGRLSVVDDIRLSDAIFAGRSVELWLPSGVSVTAEGASLEGPLPAAANLSSTSTSTSRASVAGAATSGQRFVVTPEKATFKLLYQGVIADAPRAMATEHQRAFSVSSGIISDEGIYLPHWLPMHPAGRVTFQIEIRGLAPGWEAVLPGEPRRDGKIGARSANAFAEVPLVAGLWSRREKQIGSVTAVTLLRSDDAALSSKYLDVTAQYLELYQALIGPFPYRSFALVENFWETGYGMPGFTLLGPKIIRFPFILHSSYPHELLHNYFGNGVFLPAHGQAQSKSGRDDAGNWSEGLTAYLADHLVAEQRGKGAAHRLAILTRYQDFVDEDTDFPVRQFTARNSPASEAIGYGKWALTLHMLRLRIGDAAFKQTISDFYKTHRFARTGFRDFQKAAEFASGQSLERFFKAWLDRTGAPALRWSDAQAYKPAAGPWSLSLTLEQTQPGAAYPMRVPVFITLKNGDVTAVTVDFETRKSVAARFELRGQPLRIDVDPAFDTFRRLRKGEVPPQFSGALGAKKQVFVIADWASDDAKEKWQAFSESVCPAPERCQTLIDKDVADLPRDAAVWLLGYANLLRAGAFVQAKRQGASFDDGWLKVEGQRYLNGQHSIAIALNNPANDNQTLVFVGADKVSAIPGLARKLPHYGKYGVLAFTGDEPSNVFKAQWQAQRSPLTIRLHPEASATLQLPAREALASLPSPFDKARMRSLVEALAAPELEGRGYGSAGLQRAAELIETAMKDAGLQPSGGDGFRQCFTDVGLEESKRPLESGGKAVSACNIVGRVPGKNPSLSPVILGAHYDHLGRGWPKNAIRSEHAGKIHPGANDNASGVAVMLEVARALAAAGGGDRTLIVVAFTGEESGLRGSREFVRVLQNAGNVGGGATGNNDSNNGSGDAQSRHIHSAIVLDTVGQRTDKAFLIMGHESASDWIHAFHGVGFVTGVDVAMGAPGLTASDHGAFIEQGIPAVQIFAGPAPEIHTPQDVPAVVRDKDLADAAAITHEVLTWLRGLDRPLKSSGLTSSGHGSVQKGHAQKNVSGRKVQTGAVPDFKFAGPGVRLGSVLEGSALKNAGLRRGDILISLDGQKIRDLRHYSRLLRRLKPGQEVLFQAQRGADLLEVKAVLQAR